jgi:TonB-linked SusC/RagA family outer membrane protein
MYLTISLFCRRRNFTKTLLVMKFTAIILLSACLVANANGYAQITLNEKNASLQKVFKQIQKQSGYDFLYNYELLQQSGKVNIDVQAVSLEQALEACFKNKPLTYVIIDRTIVVKPKELVNTVNDTEKAVSIKVVLPIVVRGKIVDEKGKSLEGVSIQLKGSTIGTSTNANGEFQINVPDNSSMLLVFSFIGMQSQEINVRGKSEINISLQPKELQQQEVVVLGYTSLKKASISGAATAVDMNELSKTRIPDVAQALQGQVAGVFVAANTGAPGDGIKIRIRGEGTLGNNDVLYVVDGVPTRDISFLNQSDIKSMTVLKDASATAIYGSRAASGVVVITTISGIKGKTNIAVDYNSGFYTATHMPKMLDAGQYLTVKDMAWHNTTGNASADVSPYAQLKSRPDLANTNWQKELFTTGISKNLQVSANGGTDNVQYLLSAGYFGEDGIVVENHDKYQRVNFRANINVNLSDRLRVGTNFQISNAVQDKLSSSGDAPGIIRHAMLRPPVLSVYKNTSDPTYKPADPYTDLPFYADNLAANSGHWNGAQNKLEFTSNPIAIVHFTDNTLTTFQTFGNVFGEYSFLRDKSLKFKSNLGVDISFAHNKNFGQNFGDDDGGGGATYGGMGRNNRPNSLNEYRGETKTFTFSNTLNYQTTFNAKHSVNALLGTETISSRQDVLSGTRINFDNSTDPFRYLDYGSTSSIWNGGTAPNNWNLVSFFGSATYGYENKYFLTATARQDGSSRFGPSHKWGFFPSISGAWVVSQEKFMNNVGWISNLKIRASWGASGNQEIPNDAYQTVVTQVGGVVNKIRYGNPDVKWESTKQTDIGIDLSVLKNKLVLSADYFNKSTNDILLAVPLPAVSVGVIQSTYINSGAINNKGFEMAVRYQNFDRAFKYSVNANIATLKNNVTNLYTFVPNIIDNTNHTKTQAGQPINAYYGYAFNGIYQNAGEVSKTLFTNTNGTQPGDIKFKDINGDGQIDDNDRTFIGNPIPKFTYGFSFSAGYKNFDFSFLFQGVKGVDRYNDLKQILNYDTRPFNSTTAVLNSWTREGSTNEIPRLTFNDNGGSKVSSVFVEDASYLRLKNIELGYTLHVEKARIKNLRFYISGQNLLTATKYTGLDPESTSLKDQGTYPQMRAFMVGAKINL